MKHTSVYESESEDCPVDVQFLSDQPKQSKADKMTLLCIWSDFHESLNVISIEKIKKSYFTEEGNKLARQWGR